jgi:hypothetical protein
MDNFGWGGEHLVYFQKRTRHYLKTTPVGNAKKAISPKFDGAVMCT